MLTWILYQLGFCSFSPLNLGHLPVFSHAFATPMTTLNLALDELELKLGELEELRSARLAADRLQQLLKLASNQSKLSQLEISGSFNLVQAVKEIKSYFWTQPLTVVISPDLDKEIRLRGEKLIFQETLVNLVKNAFEAYLPSAAGVVLLSLSQTANSIFIDVIDFAPHPKGRAIPKPFGGWGVGLAFAKKALTQLFQAEFKLEIYKARGAHAQVILPINPKD